MVEDINDNEEKRVLDPPPTSDSESKEESFALGSSTHDPILTSDLDEVSLSPQQVILLKESEFWVSNAAAELGRAYLDHEDAKRRCERTKAALQARSATTKKCETDRARVVVAIAEMLNLPAGECVYDRDVKLVRKDRDDG